MPPACVLEGRDAAAILRVAPASPAKQGFPKGTPLWHTTLLAKCSVLYLLSRLAGKMRVSPDGNTRFARQENGQVFADGDEQKPEAGFREGRRDMRRTLTRHNGYELSRAALLLTFRVDLVF